MHRRSNSGRPASSRRCLLPPPPEGARELQDEGRRKEWRRGESRREETRKGRAGGSPVGRNRGGLGRSGWDSHPPGAIGSIPWSGIASRNRQEVTKTSSYNRLQLNLMKE
eukprot:3656636-Rhodomonas_salina.1